MSGDRMIRMGPVVDQLKSAGCKRVDSIIEYAALTNLPPHLPHFFVVPEGERAGDNKLLNAIDQRVAAKVGVVIVINAQARANDAPGEALEREIGIVRDALLGWSHPDASGPMLYSGSSLLSADGRAIAWSVSFSVPYHLRKVG